MSDPTAEASRWHGYYAAQTGRATRPIFEEVMAHYPAGPDGLPQRLAVELGSGDGTETVALAARGWRVLAVDKQAEAMERLRSKLLPEQAAMVETRVAAFEEVVLPACDLIHAGYSLPFTPPAHFPTLWRQIVAGLKPGGRLAGQLFGNRDSWAVDPAMTCHTRVEALALLAPFEVEVLREREEDGNSFRGPKHWHVFDLIARRRAGP